MEDDPSMAETEHLVAQVLADGSPNAPTVVIGRLALAELRRKAEAFDDLKRVAGGMSPGPFQWGIIDPEQDAAEHIRANLASGTDPNCHTVLLPGDARSDIGSDPMRPNHAVTMCITGNGPTSKANALGIIEILGKLQ